MVDRASRYQPRELLDVIRLKCLYCRRTPYNVKLCPCKLCPLYRFRFGNGPKRAGKEAET